MHPLHHACRGLDNTPSMAQLVPRGHMENSYTCCGLTRHWTCGRMAAQPPRQRPQDRIEPGQRHCIAAFAYSTWDCGRPYTSRWCPDADTRLPRATATRPFLACWSRFDAMHHRVAAQPLYFSRAMQTRKHVTLIAFHEHHWNEASKHRQIDRQVRECP